MVVAQINVTCGIGSTGKICVGISKLLSHNNVENYILCSESDGYDLGVVYSNKLEIKIQALQSRILGNYGFNSAFVTKKLIRKLEEIGPDVVHIHNIHGHNVHFGKLFSFLKKNKIKVYYTFHDCWAFTGYCPHFVMAKCGKWKTGCEKCELSRKYSWFFDRSTSNYIRKFEALNGLDMTIIAPSKWLAELVKQSFLKNYSVKVINNGINLDVFKPIDSDFRDKYGLKDKKIVLGVSFGWSVNKGIDVFVELAKRLPNDYRIVLVGTNDDIDKILPNNVTSIHRTNNQEELAEIYTAADVFANPTREEVFGLTNVEALACGTPGVTFRSGGSPECYDETCGSVVECDDIDAMEKEIVRFCIEKPYSRENCIKKAREFDQNARFKEYADLYERIDALGT